jgi:hypothetical protein
MLGRSSSGAEHCDGDIRGLPDPPRKRIHSPLDGSHETTLSGVSVNWWVAPIGWVFGCFAASGVGRDWWVEIGGWHRLSSWVAPIMLGRSSSGAEHCDGDIRGLPDPPRKRIHSPLDGSHKTTLSGVSVNWWVAPIELVGGTDWIGGWHRLCSDEVRAVQSIATGISEDYPIPPASESTPRSMDPIKPPFRVYP